MITNIVNIGVLYLGFGFFLSRFLDSKVRNVPLTWLFLTIVFLPILIGAVTLIVPINHQAVLLMSVGFAILGYLVFQKKRFHRFHVNLFTHENKVQTKVLLLYIAILVLFLAMLIPPKLSLLNSSEIGVGDDFTRVSMVISTGYDLARPREFGDAGRVLHYYYYNWLMPGVVFRTTPLNAQQAWFLHNILGYVAVLSFLLYIGCNLFRKVSAQLFFFLSFSFLGGFDSFLYRLFGQNPAHAEWWKELFPLTKSFTFQVSSFYTLFLWVPHHLLAGIIFLLILILSIQRKNPVHKILIAILFGGLYSFSTFVFFTGAISYAIAELLLFLKSKSKASDIKWYGIQACIAALLLSPLLFRQSSNGVAESVLRSQTLIFDIIDFPRLAAAPILDNFFFFFEGMVNFAITWSFILWVDMGVIFLFALFYFVSHKNKGRDWRWILGHYALIACLVTLLILTFKSSRGFNDLFMRGIIVAQVGFIIGAALFLEKVSFQKRYWVLLSLPLLLQASHVINEFQGMKLRGQAGFNELFSYVQNVLPKNAVVLTDRSNTCEHVAFMGNRLCKSLDFDEVVNFRGFQNVYYMSAKKIDDPAFKLLHSSSRYLYAVNGSLKPSLYASASTEK